MLFKQNYSIQGEFKFDIYSANGELKSSIGGIKNFITSTGLTFPMSYTIADCFRFISLGSGTINNSITGNGGLGTTGLQIPLSKFKYIGSRTAYNDISTSQYEVDACGFNEETGSVVISRAWRVPTGSITFDDNYTFSEVMLSPGCPSNSGICGTEAGSLNGSDASDIADYYDGLGKSICNATGAFTRIISSISVTSADYMIANYALTVTYDTTPHSFGIVVDNTKGGANWNGTLTGIAGVVNHGLQLINDGTATSPRTQIIGGHIAREGGESYIPLWGCPFEPSVPLIKLNAYLSTDNQQFLVNNVSGGKIDLSSFQPYTASGFPFSSGVMAFRSNPSDDTSTSLYNIRNQTQSPLFPNPSDFRTLGSNPGDLDYINSSQLTNSFNTYIPSGRSRTKVISAQFRGLNANLSGWDGSSKQVRSMVFSYTDGDGLTFPFYDILFGDSGSNILPIVDTGAYTIASDPTDYFYLENGGDLTLSFNLTWSSPCGTADGC